MHFFPESLTSPAADWYWRLEHAQIQSWGQLATLFLRQYSFNESLTPTRAQLEVMRKGDNESFREYAQRWRHLAAQIQPPLGKQEMINYFLRTITTPFIEMMAVGVYNDFSELIPVGERIEVVYKAGKLGFLKGESLENGKQKAFVKAKRKEGEPGDLVLRKILPHQEEDRGKWAPNYQGLYAVKHAFSGGALVLVDMDGQELPNSVNSDAVKKYYP
ncbi:hypothetical protein L6164_037375 [Bauhinia variegata]|uniref:Uncharacterized protein n=1 Tax=Bauhinia variegata TaxID=167791 RepID=A0ACB9KJU9_BAUVA|nr:hypothetical protein L6164_037375 [Bauhinia variegata]